MPRLTPGERKVVRGAFLVLLGGLAVAQAALHASHPPLAQPAADGRLEIHAVAEATGKPLEGATVEWQLRINSGKLNKTTSTTGSDGKAVLDWPKTATVNSLSVTVRKPGFAPCIIHWADSAHPVRLPASKVLRLAPGVTIGGFVRDEAGNPVAGATIKVQAPPTESEQSYVRFTVFETTTDAQGRWRIDDAPADLSGVHVGIQARRFLGVSAPPSRNLTSVTVLKRGFTVKGRVLDARGNPIPGANVRAGSVLTSGPNTKTDSGGEFVLEDCPPGASTITARADGFAPDLRNVHPEDKPALEFRLEPGDALRGKVVDRDGTPVPRATIAAAIWRKERSLVLSIDSGPDGRFEWRGAPADPVLYDVFKPGYMSRRSVTLSPADAEQLVTLDPELIISGRVSAAATGRPLPRFRVVPGVLLLNDPTVRWLVQDAAEFVDGHYVMKYAEPHAGYSLRVEASGFKPAESRVFKPDELTPSFDFVLTPAAPSDRLAGVVLRPDGTPAVGVEVALATPDHPLVFEIGEFKFSHGSGMSFTKTGPDGRFSLDRHAAPYLLAATGDDGYAQAHSALFEKSNTLSMIRWGKIRGEARIGRKLAAGQLINFYHRNHNFQPGGLDSFYLIQTRTDERGRFVFERVIPGPSEVARVVVTNVGNGTSLHMGCWQEPVDVAPGDIVLARIGGTGRPVIGRIKLPESKAPLVDWRRNPPATLSKSRPGDLVPPGADQDPHWNDRFAASFDKDGRFRIDDVPPGRYWLTARIDPLRAPNARAGAGELGVVMISVDIPAGDEDVPVDVGEIEPKLVDR